MIRHLNLSLRKTSITIDACRIVKTEPVITISFLK
jgi:hypothetical protein